MKEQIEVIILPQEFSHAKYTDNKDCYLAVALKEQGYENVSVSGWGFTYIADKAYKPAEEYNVEIVQIAFRKGKSIKVTLKEVQHG